MVKEVFYQILLSLKYYKPDLKFIIVGDFNQLPPVKDTVEEDIYKSSKALHELVDGTFLELVHCRRSDAVLYNLCNEILDGKHIDISRFEDKLLTFLNICYTNKTRMEVNTLCMNEFIKQKMPTKVLHVKKLEYDDNTQDYKIAPGMPLIARKSSKTVNVVNNEMFKVEKIKSDVIVLSNDLKQNIEVPIERVNKLFNLAFALTIHKSQGATFKQHYTIHEWSRLNRRLKYVAMSRSSDINLIHINRN